MTEEREEIAVSPSHCAEEPQELASPAGRRQNLSESSSISKKTVEKAERRQNKTLAQELDKSDQEAKRKGKRTVKSTENAPKQRRTLAGTKFQADAHRAENHPTTTQTRTKHQNSRSLADTKFARARPTRPTTQFLGDNHDGEPSDERASDEREEHDRETEHDDIESSSASTINGGGRGQNYLVEATLVCEDSGQSAVRRDDQSSGLDIQQASLVVDGEPEKSWSLVPSTRSAKCFCFLVILVIAGAACGVAVVATSSNQQKQSSGDAGNDGGANLNATSLDEASFAPPGALVSLAPIPPIIPSPLPTLSTHPSSQPSSLIIDHCRIGIEFGIPWADLFFRPVECQLNQLTFHYFGWNCSYTNHRKLLSFSWGNGQDEECQDFNGGPYNHHFSGHQESYIEVKSTSGTRTYYSGQVSEGSEIEIGYYDSGEFPDELVVKIYKESTQSMTNDTSWNLLQTFQIDTSCQGSSLGVGQGFGSFGLVEFIDDKGKVESGVVNLKNDEIVHDIILFAAPSEEDTGIAGGILQQLTIGVAVDNVDPIFFNATDEVVGQKLHPMGEPATVSFSIPRPDSSQETGTQAEVTLLVTVEAKDSFGFSCTAVDLLTIPL